MSKFYNKKTVIDDITFDSILEAKFYEFAKEVKARGDIKDFEVHKRFEIFSSFEKNGEKFRKVEYIADFVIYHHDGEKEIIDTKGIETDVFKLKRKLFEYRYPDLTLKTVAYSKIDGGWISLKELKANRNKRKKGKD